jgi:hypothetical protein
MRRLLAALVLPILAAGCSGAGKTGLLSVGATDPDGRGAGNFAFAAVASDGKVAWAEVPAIGRPTREMPGGRYSIVVISSRGAGTDAFKVNGHTDVTVKLGVGATLRGETRHDQKPIRARIFMPIPGRGPDDIALSHEVRAADNGMFTMSRLPPGKWSLWMGTREAGYKLVEVDLKDGKTTELGIIEIP